MQEMTRAALEEEPLDLILVVGGWDSSNTGHLLEIPVHAGVTAYHVNAASCISPDNSITHRTVEGAIEVRVADACPWHGEHLAGQPVLRHPLPLFPGVRRLGCRRPRTSCPWTARCAWA